MRKIIFFIVALVFAASAFPAARAQEQADRIFEASIGAAGLSRDLSLPAFNGALEIGLPAGRLSAPAVVAVTELSEAITPPAGLALAGTAYQIDIPADAFKAGDYYLSFKSSGSPAFKQVYFFDKNEGWRPLATTENFSRAAVNAAIAFPSVRVAVFENAKFLVKGQASWYRYKNGLFAASPDFPLGTRLRVINTDNKKFVDVTVNDHGPNRAAHPTRVVDLDAAAFARLAPLGQGTVSVSVEKLPAAASSAPAPATVKAPPGQPKIQARAALILNSADKKVIWSKDADSVVPLASLTKLVAVRTFLDTKPDLKKVVAYSVKDEQLNYKYVSPAESGALHLKDKDTLTIKDLVYSSLIGSTNNTVETLVRVSGMTREQFIKKMNANVVAWGAKKTRFAEPTGLSTKNVTTAAEYAIIARETFLSPLIAEATARPSYTVTTVNTKKAHSFKNTNLLARDKNSGLLGSKTGFLHEAGNCLVTKWPTAADKNVIVIVLGAPSRQAGADDTKALLAFARSTIQ